MNKLSKEEFEAQEELRNGLLELGASILGVSKEEFEDHTRQLTEALITDEGAAKLGITRDQLEASLKSLTENVREDYEVADSEAGVEEVGVEIPENAIECTLSDEVKEIMDQIAINSAGRKFDPELHKRLQDALDRDVMVATQADPEQDAIENEIINARNELIGGRCPASDLAWANLEELGFELIETENVGDTFVIIDGLKILTVPQDIAEQIAHKEIEFNVSFSVTQ